MDPTEPPPVGWSKDRPLFVHVVKGPRITPADVWGPFVALCLWSVLTAVLLPVALFCLSVLGAFALVGR